MVDVDGLISRDRFLADVAGSTVFPNVGYYLGA